MKFFRKVLKNKLFYLVLVLGLFLIPIFKFNLQAQEDDYVDYSNKNLASPDLDGKEYLGDGNYRLYDNFGITIDYNVNNGIFTINGTVTTNFSINLSNNITLGQLTGQIIVVGGSANLTYSDWRFASNTETTGRLYYNGYHGGYVKSYIKTENISDIRFGFPEGNSFDNFQFKIQLEKGDTATPYAVPLQPYLWHEKQLSYNDGFDEGFYEGESLGYGDGYDAGRYDYGIYINGEWVNATDYGELQYNDARGEYGIYINGEWVNATDYGVVQYNDARGEYGIFIDDEWISAVDYGDIQYNEARDEYGIFIDDEWISATDYGDIKYNDGYQDGVSDTHDYYNDNGLFIPKLTPQGHLAVEHDDRYNDPYFYLYNLYNVDDYYFSFPTNRFLERAFQWAYNNETDFLVFNHLFEIKYQTEDVIYKYFFYKYDTDSIYFYNDNGTLLKVVERDDFDYYVYEVPELSEEEQARIDNAYDKGMRDYGYYDSESEEYLTATEYGDIQYNLGVQSTRDNAYSDGFVVAMWYSHLYGYDWLHATYYDLIAERPILYSVHDVTSYSYQEGYNEGFEDGDSNGYDRGYDWGYDDGKIDGIDIGYDDGYIDGEEDGYNKGYQKAVDNTYDAIYEDVYNIGYKDGEKSGMNNKFYSGLEKWIVPALIVVLFFGLLMLFPRKRED